MKRDQNLYLAERVRASLAEEPGVCELGIEVVVVEERILLRGTVTSLRRKAQVLAHVREQWPDLEVGDELSVEEIHEPTTESL